MPISHILLLLTLYPLSHAPFPFLHTTYPYLEMSHLFISNLFMMSISLHRVLSSVRTRAWLSHSLLYLQHLVPGT